MLPSKVLICTCLLTMHHIILDSNIITCTTNLKMKDTSNKRLADRYVELMQCYTYIVCFELLGANGPHL